MAPAKLTDYERKRLENIRRNEEVMAALKVRSKATELQIDGGGDFKIGDSLIIENLKSKPENVAQVLPGRIMAVKFFPWPEKRMIVAGDDFGNIGFWNVDSGEEETGGMYRYHPHPVLISGISIHRCSSSKMFTSCYAGFIKLMDAEKEVFDLIHSSADIIYSLSQRPDDMKCLYFGEGKGGLNIWDERSGKSATQWNLHESRINTIDFNEQNPNIMSTSSTDGTACIWDLRSVNADKPTSLATVSHKRAVQSAYFSPCGKFLATTGYEYLTNLGHFETNLLCSVRMVDFMMMATCALFLYVGLEEKEDTFALSLWKEMVFE